MGLHQMLLHLKVILDGQAAERTVGPSFRVPLEVLGQFVGVAVRQFAQVTHESRVDASLFGRSVGVRFTERLSMRKLLQRNSVNRRSAHFHEFRSIVLALVLFVRSVHDSVLLD